MLLQELFSIKEDYTHIIVNVFKVKFKIKKKNINYKANIAGKNKISLNKNFHGKLIVKGNNNFIDSKCQVNKSYIKICGDNNTIVFPKDNSSLIKNINIHINGSNNVVVIKHPNCFIGNLNIYIGYFVNNNEKWHIYQREKITNNAKVIFGGNSTLNTAVFMLPENDTGIIIGDNCMLSDNIEFYASDFHTVFDKNNHCVLNRGENIIVGNHCWIGKKVFICKNTKIPANSIVGACSVLTKKFEEENIIIAGNPAKIVKRNINWDRLLADECKNGVVVERERERERELSR